MEKAKIMEEKLEKILVPMNSKQLYDTYLKWSDDYENDMPHCRYQAPFRTAECFFELNLPKNLLILDIGAGTGWLGQALFQNGYHWIDALDACDKMLEKAKLKKVYRNYIQTYVSPDYKLPILEETYDVVIMTGVFVPGHLPVHENTFRQILKVLKKGGILAWSMPNPDRFSERDESYKDKKFDKIIQILVDSKNFQILEGYPKIFSDYFKGENGYFYATEKL